MANDPPTCDPPTGDLPPSALAEWKAHWPVVLAAMLGMSFYTVVTYSFGTFTQPIEQTFHWPRATVALGLTIFAAIATVGGPFVGALIDRTGTRLIAVLGTIASGLAFAAFSLASGSVAQWVMLWVIFGIAALFIKSTIWSAGVSSIFSTSRGLALAAMLSGSALGQTLAPLIANALITRRGWRFAYQGLGFGWAGLALAAVLLFYRDARSLGRRAEARPADDPVTALPILPGLTAREGMRDLRIVRICIANLVMSTFGAGITAQLVPLIVETGVSRSEAVGIAASAGVAGLVGKFLTGWLVDRWQGSIVPFGSYAIASLGYFLLLDQLRSPVALTAGVMILGYAAGAGLQVTTYLVSRYAGLRAFGALFGTIASATMLGTALGPLIAARLHDVYGTYHPVLIVAVPVMLLSALLFVGLGPYPVFTVSPEREPASPLVPEAAI